MRDTKLVVLSSVGGGGGGCQRGAREAFWRRSVLTGLGLNAHDILVVYMELGVWRDDAWVVLVVAAAMVRLAML
jgi:hypothetical protein